MNQHDIERILAADQRAEARASIQLDALDKRQRKLLNKSVRKLQRRELQARAFVGEVRP